MKKTKSKLKHLPTKEILHKNAKNEFKETFLLQSNNSNYQSKAVSSEECESGSDGSIFVKEK